LQGQRDVPLNARGRDQALSLGRALGVRFRPEIDALEAAAAFVASPLKRARETMELIRAAMALEPTRYRLDGRLMELSFGDWEGLTWAEIAARDPQAVRRRRGDKWNFVPPGGESYTMLAQRVQAWLSTLTGSAFVVAHGGTARALMTLIAGVPGPLAAATPIAQGRALLFDKGRFGPMD
ncbi:MAG: histidine phosphatase family protein, partial [Hyphomicrobiales bacterium]|nr:histidine phosphatase family protein [Hyphomicrobiales bacterium]